MATKSQIKAVLQAALGVAETIREVTAELGYCPAGPLYVALMERGADMEDWLAIVKTLENAKLIRDNGETLVWIGPTTSKQ